jgi:hypothetical protein
MATGAPDGSRKGLLLVRKGYPHAVIRKRIRTQYFPAMRRADRGKFAPLAEILGRAVQDSLDRSLLPSLAGPARSLPLSALERPGLTVRTLRAAAEKGSRLHRRRLASQAGRGFESRLPLHLPPTSAAADGWRAFRAIGGLWPLMCAHV